MVYLAFMDATDYRQILAHASEMLAGFEGYIFDIVTISQPDDLEYAIHLSKVISKLSPFLGNMIEYAVVERLNEEACWPQGEWLRQDPGFPDTIFDGDVIPKPGIEIKTWFPLATEITARFKDSISHFAEDQTNVAMLAWVPEHVIYGKPRIIDVWVDSASSVARARDNHYHNPPDYLVFEPEDTTSRTRNLQQTNTNGYKFQGSHAELVEAEIVVAKWGPEGKVFSHSPEYQARLQDLLGRYRYRLDTNFAKMDRIEHPSLEAFKAQVLQTRINGHTVEQWFRILRNPERRTNAEVLKQIIQQSE